MNLERGLLADSDEFGDFAAFRSTSPPQSHAKDDTFFSAFESNTVMQPQQVIRRGNWTCFVACYLQTGGTQRPKLSSKS